MKTSARFLLSATWHRIAIFAVLACATACGSEIDVTNIESCDRDPAAPSVSAPGPSAPDAPDGGAPKSDGGTSDAGATNGSVGPTCNAPSDCGSGLACHAGVCTDQTPPKAGLVGWWNFDAPAPAAIDASGYGNSGTAQGNVSQVPGRVGLAYSFDGGCVGVPDSPSLAMAGGNQVTTMAWVKAASACSADNCEFMNKENTYEMAQGSGTVLGNEQPWEAIPGAFGEAIMRSDGQWFWNEQTPNVITLGTWLHVAVTWDGSSVTRYLNGAVLSDPSNPRALDSTSTFAASGWGLGIGCRAVAADGNVTGVYPTVAAPFTGVIDEAAVYDRALTPAEIAAYYAATK